MQHYAYSSFGKIVKISDGSGSDVTANPPVKTSYGFTNREHDEESGMMYYRARFYSPEIGRFISEDPHPGKLSMPGTVTNKYIYVLNNPAKYVDPKGEFLIEAMIIGAIIGGLDAHFRGENILEGMARGALAGAAIATFYTTALAATGSTTAFWVTMGTSAYKAGTTDNGKGFVDNFINISMKDAAIGTLGVSGLEVLQFHGYYKYASWAGMVGQLYGGYGLYEHTCHNEKDESSVECEEIKL